MELISNTATKKTVWIIINGRAIWNNIIMSIHQALIIQDCILFPNSDGCAIPPFPRDGGGGGKKLRGDPTVEPHPRI